MITDVVDERNKAKADAALADWMFSSGLSFNVIDNQAFRIFVRHAAAFGPSYMVPTRMTMRGSLLDSCADRLDSKLGPVHGNVPSWCWYTTTFGWWETQPWMPMRQSTTCGRMRRRRSRMRHWFSKWTRARRDQQGAAPQVRRLPSMGHMWRAE
eukprot:365296-Chlamydomonas_euryale.AAC.14